MIVKIVHALLSNQTFIYDLINKKKRPTTLFFFSQSSFSLVLGSDKNLFFVADEDYSRTHTSNLEKLTPEGQM